MKKFSQLGFYIVFIMLFMACSSNNNAQNNQENASASESQTTATTSTSESEVQTSSIDMNANDYVVIISTQFGEIALVLFEETPKHRENFLKLAKEGFYDSTMFHRVINNFMIQGGDPNTKDPDKSPREYGIGGPDYKIPAEIVAGLKHKKGALAAARQGDQVNPKRESSGSQFYIVQHPNGTPHLDGQYTIFGQTIAGLDVLDKIATQPVLQPQSMPKEPIRMSMRVEEMKRSEISEKYGYDFSR